MDLHHSKVNKRKYKQTNSHLLTFNDLFNKMVSPSKRAFDIDSKFRVRAQTAHFPSFYSILMWNVDVDVYFVQVFVCVCIPKHLNRTEEHKKSLNCRYSVSQYLVEIE